MNRRRSVTAERMYRNDARLQVRAAGLRSESPRRVSETDLKWADVVFVMEREHKAILKKRFRSITLPLIDVLDVPDEYECMDPQLQELFRLIVDPAIEAILKARSET